MHVLESRRYIVCAKGMGFELHVYLFCFVRSSTSKPFLPEQVGVSFALSGLKTKGECSATSVLCTMPKLANSAFKSCGRTRVRRILMENILMVQVEVVTLETIPQMHMHNDVFRYIFGAVRWVKQVCNCPRRLDGQVCVMESQPLVVVGSWLRVSAGNFSNSSQPCTCFVLVSCPRHDSTACVNASLAAVTRNG
jgi:hypothetical protein